jgi:signal transduction histidine kinase
MDSMTLRKRIIGGFLISFLVLWIVTLLSLIEGSHLKAGLETINHTFKIHDYLGRIHSDILEMDESQKAFAVTGDKEFLELYTQAQNRIFPLLMDIRSLMIDQSSKEEMDRIERLIIQRRFDRPYKFNHSNEIRKTLNSLQLAQENLLNKENFKIHSILHRNFILDLIGILITIFLLLFGPSFLIRPVGVLENEKKLSRMLERIIYASFSIAEESTNTDGDSKRMFQIIVEQARNITGADYGALRIRTDPSNPNDPWIFSGINEDQSRLILAKVSKLDKTVQNEAVRIDDIRKTIDLTEFTTNHPNMRAFLAVPIRHKGKSIGNLYLSNSIRKPTFTEHDQKSIELLATHLAVIIENSRLFNLVHQERARFKILSDFSATLAKTLDYSDTIKNIAQMTVPTIADSCAVDVYTPNSNKVIRIAVSATDKNVERAYWELGKKYPVEPDSEHPLAKVIRLGRGQVYTELDDLFFTKMAINEEHLALFLALNMKSGMIASISLGGRLLGALTFGSSTPGRFKEEDLSIVQEIGRRAAFALESSRLYAESQRAVQTRDDILAMVSHDLKNPLTSIRMSAELCLRQINDLGIKNKKQMSNVLHNINRYSEHMLRMIGDLLDVASIEAGKFSVRPSFEQFDIMLKELIEQLKPIADEKSLYLEYVQTTPIPQAFCDLDRIRQVCSNLIGNAIKFSHTGSRITIRLDATEEEIKFSVSDSGPGIARKNLNCLFDRYWQAKGITQRGTGLGLYISKGIIEAHAGKIWVESELGHGTTVFFLLPSAKNSKFRAVA